MPRAAQMSTGHENALGARPPRRPRGHGGELAPAPWRDPRRGRPTAHGDGVIPAGLGRARRWGRGCLSARTGLRRFVKAWQGDGTEPREPAADGAGAPCPRPRRRSWRWIKGPGAGTDRTDSACAGLLRTWLRAGGSRAPNRNGPHRGQHLLCGCERANVWSEEALNAFRNSGRCAMPCRGGWPIRRKDRGRRHAERGRRRGSPRARRWRRDCTC